MKSSPLNNWFVYIHIRNDMGCPFYVGIGSTINFKRAYDKGCRRNIIWRRITAKSEYRVSIYKDGLSLEEACNIEKFLIKQYGRVNLKTGSLCNLTNGGEGTNGRVYKMSIATKEKISKKMKGIYAGNKHPLYGKKHSEITKKKIGLKSKGRLSGGKNPFYKRKHSDENKRKISISRQKQVIDTLTGDEYSSIGDAATKLGYNYSYLACMLNGNNKNKTSLAFKNKQSII